MVHDREGAQARQYEVARGRDAACDPQPGGAGGQALLDDEVPRCGGKVSHHDEVRVESTSDGAHPRDDSG